MTMAYGVSGFFKRWDTGCEVSVTGTGIGNKVSSLVVLLLRRCFSGDHWIIVFP